MARRGGAPALLALRRVVGDVAEGQLASASRYLGGRDEARFTAHRKPHGTLVPLALDDAHT